MLGVERDGREFARQAGAGRGRVAHLGEQGTQRVARGMARVDRELPPVVRTEADREAGLDEVLERLGAADRDRAIAVHTQKQILVALAAEDEQRRKDARPARCLRPR